MNYFELTDAYKQWSHRTIDCSFSMEQSKITAIVGASGSGKSTILRIIAGLEKADARSDGKKTKIILDGKDITALPPQKRECGMVFQNPSLFLHMNVLDNVCYGLLSRGMKKKEAVKVATDALEGMGLKGMEKRLPETLSGGEAQRVALARTLVLNPKLVLLDEPLSALDAPLRKRLSKEIRETLIKRSQTAILVTHDLNEAKEMADDILVLTDGKITWSGTSANFDEASLTLV